MKTDSIKKYRPFPPVALPDRTWPDKTITHAPIWVSVDLRDGNQALPQPMTVEEKIEMFELLVGIGFKQIEVGFPSASDTEFEFLRRLIDENRIPEDVVIQVLVQARKQLIERSFEAIKGAPRAIVHLYNSTSPLQRRITFNDASREKIRDIAIEGAKIIKSLVPTVPETQVMLQYSPESFSDTEMEYAIEICEAVMDVWEPTPENKIILNLPATVEWTTPNVHADQIEWFCRNVKNRNSIIISLHTHNDRGTGTAATELGLMAGADRVEGTLFGNGERTGNLDLTTVALNMNSHGIETGLDFSDLTSIRVTYENTTRMNVHDRHPYAGELAFTAFSGSHQDAIKKGFDRRQSDDEHWAVPYLTIDPKDVGRSYEALVRINSQSGKGGIAYILERDFGFDLPKSMHPQVGKFIYDIADSQSRELTPEEVFEVFETTFVNTTTPLELISHSLAPDNSVTATIRHHGKEQQIEGAGNGPINAFAHALETAGIKDFQVTDYRSHALRGGSDADSAAYIQIRHDDGRVIWGAGKHPSIELAGLQALVTASNLLR